MKLEKIVLIDLIISICVAIWVYVYPSDAKTAIFILSSSILLSFFLRKRAVQKE